MNHQSFLGVHQVSDRQDREAHTIRLTRLGIDRGWSSRYRVAILDTLTDQSVPGNDAKPIGIEQLARPDDAIPVARFLVGLCELPRSMAIARKIRKNKKGVILGRVQVTIHFIAKSNILDHIAAHRCERGQREHLLLYQEVISIARTRIEKQYRED